MDGRGTSSANDVKQRALKVTWSTRDPDDRPTEEELIQAFTPFGTVVRVGIKELCAAVLFASTNSVHAAAASSWDKWNVLPMTRPAPKAKLGLRTADPSLAAASSTRESQAGAVHSQPSPADRETYIDRPETGARDVDVRGGSTSRSRTAIRELITTKIPAGLKNAVAMAAMKRSGNGGSSAARKEIEIDEGEEGANTVNRRTERDAEKVGGRKNASAVRPYSAPPSSLDIQHSKGDSSGRKNAYNGGTGSGGSGGDTGGTQRLIATEGRTQQWHQKVRDPSTNGQFSMIDRDDNIISRPQYLLSSLSSCSDEEGNREVFTYLRTQEKRRNTKTKQQRELGPRSSDGSVTRKRRHGARVQAKQLRYGGESKLANTHAGGSFAVLGPPAAVDRNPSPAQTATSGESPGRISEERKRDKIAPSSPPINSSCTTNANVDNTTADGFPPGRHYNSCNSDALFETQPELSPLSSPEGLRNLGSEAGGGIFVEVTTTARSPNGGGGGGGGSATHCGGWGNSTAPRTQDITDGSQCGFSAEDDRGHAVGGNTQYRHQNEALVNFRRFDHDDDAAAAVVVTSRDKAPEALCERHHMVAARGTDQRSGRLAIHADMKSSEAAMAAASAVGEDEGPPCDGGKATRITVMPNEGRMGGEGIEHDGFRVEETRRGTGEQQQASTGGRDQAKRLALEVARLRSALRGKQADLDSERATRGRLEDENWRKLRAWEEKRELIVTAKQDAERASRVLQEEVSLIRSQEKARQEKVASDHAAREAAGRNADKATEEVMKVQDRLVRALQSEVDLTNRVRESSQADAREAKEQLRLYVRDFLLWRDRAKGLEARLVALGHKQPLPAEDDTLHSTDLLTAGLDCHMSDVENVPCSKEEEEFGMVNGGSSSKTLWQRSQQTKMDGGDDDDDNTANLSVPERHAIYLETLTARFPFVADQPKQSRTKQVGTKASKSRDTESAASALFLGESMLGEGEAAEATQGGGTKSTSRAYFERSMQAQQEISARLERNLVKARTDLRMIYASHRNNGADDDDDSDYRNGGGGGGETCVEEGGENGEGIFLLAKTPRIGDDTEYNIRSDGSSGGVEPQSCQPSSSSVEGGITSSQHPRPTGVNTDAKSTDAPVNISGPYMARVLTALLGGGTQNITEATTSLGLLSGNTQRGANVHTERNGRGLVGPNNTRSPPAPPSLRLSDYPPLLQAVFSGGPATLPSPARGTSSGRRAAAKTHERVTRRVSREKGVRRQQASRHQGSTFHGAASAKGTKQTRRLSSERPSTTEDNGAESQTQRTPLPGVARDKGAAPTDHVSKGCSVVCDAQPKGVPQAVVPSVEPGRCATVGAFLGYKAQSPLLQRWLEETCSSPNRPALY